MAAEVPVHGPSWFSDGVERLRPRGRGRPVAAYVAARGTGLLVLLSMAHHARRSVTSLLLRADAGRYLAIAQHGYTRAPTLANGAPSVASPAFHPLFPLLVGGVLKVWPGSGVLPALLVVAACGVAAALALYSLGSRILDERAGILLVIVWAVLPTAVVGSMVYSENLFTALAAGGLVLVLDRRWVAAGATCALAGLTRPTAAPLVIALVVPALVAAWQRRDGWRPYACLLLAPAGLLGYWAWVGWFLGRWDGYFWLQGTVWHSRFDGGASTLHNLREALTSVRPLPVLVTTGVLLAAVVAAGLLVADRRVPGPVKTYGVTYLVLVIMTGGYYHAKARLLLPDVALLLPVVSALELLSRRVRGTLLASAAIASGWYGGYLLILWRLSP